MGERKVEGRREKREQGTGSVLERCISCSNVIENMFQALRAYPSYPYSFIAHSQHFLCYFPSLSLSLYLPVSVF